MMCASKEIHAVLIACVESIDRMCREYCTRAKKNVCNVAIMRIATYVHI